MSKQSEFEGYKVWVRTVSSLLIVGCLGIAALLFFRDSIIEFYSSQQNSGPSVVMIGILVAVAAVLAMSFWKGKFFWFL